MAHNLLIVLENHHVLFFILLMVVKYGAVVSHKPSLIFLEIFIHYNLLQSLHNLVEE